jgi:hypothetical protein
VTRRRTLIIGTAIIALVFAIGLGAGVLASSTEDEAEKIRSEAFDVAFTEARDAAHEEGMERGLEAGRSAGVRAGRLAGATAGDDAGADSAAGELAAAEAAERAANCGAPLFPDDVCPTDEEIAAENQAESLCGSGQYEEAAALGIDCGPGTSPRP